MLPIFHRAYFIIHNTLQPEARFPVRPTAKQYTLSQQGKLWLALAFIIVSGLFISRSLLTGAPLTTDEGVHLNWARLLSDYYNEGHAPFTEVYMPVPPLWPMLLKITWQTWPTLTSLQVMVLCFWVAGLIGMALLAYEINQDWKVGAGAALFLGFSIMYFRDSQAILMEMPSLVCSLYAMWAAVAYQHRGKLAHLLGSAIFCMASLWLKLLATFLPCLILTLIISRHISKLDFSRPKGQEIWSRIRRPIFLWTCAFLVLPILSLIVFDAPAMLQQMVGQRIDARAVYLAEDGDYWPPRLKRLNTFMATHRGLIILGLFGLGVAFIQGMPCRWWLLAWLGLGLLMLAWHTPIRTKHFILLPGPLALSASLLFSLKFRDHFALRNYIIFLGLGLGLIFFGLDFGKAWPTWRAYAHETQPSHDEHPR